MVMLLGPSVLFVPFVAQLSPLPDFQIFIRMDSTRLKECGSQTGRSVLGNRVAVGEEEYLRFQPPENRK